MSFGKTIINQFGHKTSKHIIQYIELIPMVEYNLFANTLYFSIVGLTNVYQDIST